MHLKTSMLQYSERRLLFKSDDKILTAVSGGVDSMVMLNMLHDAGVNIAAAHCNFNLRGEESNMDEAFVKKETEKLDIPCYVERFNTSGYAAENGISTQMAARELRYRWFHELADRKGFNAIAIAHNRDDSIETLFINLARGTSIHGLTGISSKNGKIIRPILFASRSEIEDYAKKNNIRYREDSSNASDKYARNYIRHQVIPGMQQFFPGMQQAIERSIEHFAAVETFYNEAIECYKKNIVAVENDLIYIDLHELEKSPSSPTLLYEILKQYGFPNSTAADILREQKHTSGRQFFSNTHRLIQDRQKLVISCQLPVVSCQNPVRLKIEKFDNYPGFSPETDPNVACLDSDKLQFPLLLRKWKHGDRFRPLGMKNMKKLSDFFIDAKLSIIEKERCLVLISDGKIAWIAGLRIDERFKIRKETKKIVRIKKYS